MPNTVNDWIFTTKKTHLHISSDHIKLIFERLTKYLLETLQFRLFCLMPTFWRIHTQRERVRDITIYTYAIQTATHQFEMFYKLTNVFSNCFDSNNFPLYIFPIHFNEQVWQVFFLSLILSFSVAIFSPIFISISKSIDWLFGTRRSFKS